MNKKVFRNYYYKVLVVSLTAIYTGLVASSVTQASDIEIYQEAKSGTVTLMMLLDASGSMRGSSPIRTDFDLSSTQCSSTTDSHPVGGYERTYCTVTSTVAASKPRVRSGCEKQTNGSYKCYDRWARLRDALWDLLDGNVAKGVTAIADDKAIGIIQYPPASNVYSAKVLIPARTLGTEVGGVTQRELLKAVIQDMEGHSGTPTANAYAEAGAYMMGTTTVTSAVKRAKYSYRTNSGGQWKTCSGWNSANACNSWSSSWTTTKPSSPSPDNLIKSDSGTSCATGASVCYFETYYSGSPGFAYSVNDAKESSLSNDILDKYIMPEPLVAQSSLPEGQQCSGQGIYILSDGEPNNNTNAQAYMKTSLTNTYSNNLTCTSTGTGGGKGWDCATAYARVLLNKQQNPASLKYKTAFIGFGKEFTADDLASYNKALSQQQNIQLVDSSSATADVKSAAKLGIYGEGGWYSGNSSADVVNSVNDFLDALATEIPAVTTGSPIIPRDALNPSTLQDDAYYQQFEPTPEKNYGLWIGNLKKYAVGASGNIVGRNKPIYLKLDGEIDTEQSAYNLVEIADDEGRLVSPQYDAAGTLTSAIFDFWSKAVTPSAVNSNEKTPGSLKFAAKGGVWSQLKLGEVSNVEQRKILTNRSSIGTNAGTTLRQITLQDVVGSDPDRGYLVSLLGYDVPNPSTPPTSVDQLKQSTTLRQMGAIMHSSPVLITNKGRIKYNQTTKALESSNREDYILFGTNQGLLHAVDAKTGAEKFAFLPHEMVVKQKQAFGDHQKTSGGMQSLYYGIDGQWTVYTEYVADDNGNLTVKTGKGSQKGVQDVYGGLRMGGRSYYAFDLKDINNPVLSFHIDPDAAPNTSPLRYMGQSWSKPTITWVNWEGKPKRVMIVGGGYDAGGTNGDGVIIGGVKQYQGYESDTYDQQSGIGAGVYMFDAENGNLLWWASNNVTNTTLANATTGVVGLKNTAMKYSVVSEIRVVDRDGDNLSDHIYFGDLGGQLFRVDFDNNAKTRGGFAKAAQLLFSINNDTTTVKRPRFYDMPGFSLYNNKVSKKFAVLSIGSGNRSTPLVSYDVATGNGYDYDAIFNIYDKDVADNQLYSANYVYKTKNFTKANLGEITNSNRFNISTPVAPYESNYAGWYYKFSECSQGIAGEDTECDTYKYQSEKVFGIPVVMNHRIYVSTFDSSKDGLSGKCGAGVKGESFVTTLCMPYGQCDGEIDDARKIIGAGIHTISVGNDKTDDTDPECQGEDECQNNDNDQNTNSLIPASANNYCVSTGDRMTLTLTGGVGMGESTRVCLVPQRWYERLGRPRNLS